MPVFACCCLQACDADAPSLAVPAVILLLSRAVARLCLRLLIRILTQNSMKRLLLRRWWPRPCSECCGAVLMCTYTGHAGPLDSRSHRVLWPSLYNLETAGSKLVPLGHLCGNGANTQKGSDISGG